MRKFLDKVTLSVSRLRMKDREFQREIDSHRLYLLLSHRAAAIKERKSVKVDDTNIRIEADAILQSGEILSTNLKEKECKAMVDVQIKTYFKLWKV